MSEYVKQESAGFWNPTKEGEEIEGVIVSVKDGLYGFQWTIENKENDKIVTPSHKMLQSLMEGLEKGDQVKLVFTGTKPSEIKGRADTKLYEVFKKE